MPMFLPLFWSYVNFLLFGSFIFLFFIGRHIGAKECKRQSIRKAMRRVFLEGIYFLFIFCFLLFFSSFYRLVRLLFSNSPLSKASSPSTPLHSSSGSRVLFLEDTETGGGGGGGGVCVSRRVHVRWTAQRNLSTLAITKTKSHLEERNHQRMYRSSHF